MDIKTQKMLADVVLNAQNKAVKPYTTTATVKSVNNGIVYVEIPGSDRDTPVKNSSVSVKKGDVVDLVVSHDDTHITGNRSDVAVPESTAQKMSQTLEATRLEMDNELDLFNNKIKMVNNSIEMQDNKIEMQNNTITQFGNTIDQQNNIIEQQNNIIEQQNNNITEIGNTVNSQNNTITEIRNKVNSQGNTITEIGNTVNSQGNDITELNNTVNAQGNKITEIGNTVNSQGNDITEIGNKVNSQNNTITELDNTITEIGNKVNSQGNTITEIGNTIELQDSSIKTLDSTVKTQGSNIETLGSNVEIINSAFVIQDGKLTGLSEIVTNILKSGYVTTDLLNADVAWIENGKIKEGAIGTTEIADASITTAKIDELSADVIKTGTIRTERLILTTDEVDPGTGEKKVALITALNAKVNSGEGNILDGAVIADETIEAAKIDVVDLNAFNATIGNFTIGTSSMYNGKTSLKDPTNGVYIGTDGIALGQGSLLGMTDDSPFRVESDGDFHLGAKDGNYINFNAFTGELDINAKSIKMGSKSVASTEDVTTAIEGIEVGGRNILLNSKFNLNADKWGIQDNTISEYVVKDGRKCAHINRSAMKTTKYVAQSVLGKLEPDTVYTMSGWILTENIVKGTTNFICAFYHDGLYSKDGTSTWYGYGAKTLPINAGKWIHLEWTFMTDSEKLKNARSSYIYVYTRDLTGDIYFSDLKLEKGNKATDWTPAPEDIEDGINTKLEDYATLEVTNNKISTAVTETKTYADGKASDAVSTAKSYTDQTKDGIISTVSKTYTTKTEFDNLQIGGRNLLLGSANPVNKFSWNGQNGSATITEETMLGVKGILLDVTAASTGRQFCYYEFGASRIELIKPNSYYTLSFDVYPNVDNLIYFKIMDLNASNAISSYSEDKKIVANQWNHISLTVETFATITISDQVIYIRGSNKVATYKICNFKLEEGNKATDWTPAPEDTEAEIQSVKTIAEQTADKFSWLVKSGTSATNFELTDRVASLLSEKFDIDALTTFKNSAENGTSTVINGGAIDTDSLFAKAITATNMTISGDSKFGNFYASDTIEGLAYENSNYGGVMYLGKIAALIDEDEYGFQLGNGNSMTNIQPGGVFVQSNCGGSYSRKTTIHGGFIETYCISTSQSGGTVSIGSDIVPLYSDEDTLLDITLGSSSKKFADLYTSKFNGTSVNSNGIASTSGYGVTKLSSSYTSSSTSTAANSKAVCNLYNITKTIVTRGVATGIFSSCTYANKRLRCVKINSVTYSMTMFGGVIEVKSGSTAISYQWSPFFQIPEGFRPSTTMQTVVHVFDTDTSRLSVTYAVEIHTDGIVYILGSFVASESFRFVFPCIMYI